MVQTFLFWPVVLTSTNDFETEDITIEPQTHVGIPHDDRRMVNTQEQPVCLPMPPGMALSGGKLQDFEDMAVRVAKVKRLNAGRL